MERIQRTRDLHPLVASVVVGLIAGVVVLVLLMPVHGVDTLPPRCFAVIGNEVPCGGTVGVIAAIAAAFLVGVGVWVRRRDR